MNTPADRDVHITTSEIADMADGVGPSAVSNWRKRFDDFPQPAAGTPANPLFIATEVAAWLDRHDKRGARRSAAQRLWSTFNAWRSEMRVDDLVEISTGLITFRYLTDSGAQALSLPDAGSWPEILEGDPLTLPERIQAEARRLESKDESWSGIFEPLLDADPRVLVELVRVVDDLPASTLSDVFEELLDQFRRSGGKAGSDWSSSPALVELLVESAGVIGNTVYDPAAGAGGSLLAAAQRHDGRLLVTGQELNPRARRIGEQRLIVHGFEGIIAPGDSLRTEAFIDMRADTVLLHPPYGLAGRGEQFGYDPRWQFGTPPDRSADLAWVQLAIWHLAPRGRAYVLLSAGAMYRGGAEARIRSEIIRRGSLECVVALPGSLATHTSAPLTLWVVARPGETSDPHQVLLVDATGEEQHFNPKTIGRAVRDWRELHKVPKDLPAAAVPVLDLLAPEAALTPARWIRPAILGDDGDPLAQLREHLATLNRHRDILRNLPRLRPALVQVGDLSTKRITIEQLITDGQMSLLRGTKIRADHLGSAGLPVYTAAVVRQPMGSPESLRVEPSKLNREPFLTEAGDVLVVTEGTGIAARVDPKGGAAVAAPVQVLRLGRSWLTSEFLAASLTNPLNNRFLVGSAIPRAQLKQLEIPIVDPDEQIALVEYLKQLENLTVLARSIADGAEMSSEMLIAGTSVGAIRVGRAAEDAQHDDAK